MSAISLLRLPSFAQDIIVSSLDPAQVLGLTLHSKIMHRIVSRSKYSKIPVAQMTSNRAGIKILTIIDRYDSYISTPRRFWSVKDVDCDRFRNGFYVNFNDGQEKFVTEHLLSVFNISQFKVSIETGTFEEISIFQHVKQFKQVCLERMTLTASQLKFLLEDIQTDSLILSKIPQITDYQRDFVFNHREITFHTCPFIPFSVIMSMKTECLSVRLNVTDSTIQNLVEFMKKWISKGMEHFKHLTIEYDNLTDQIVNSVLREIDEIEENEDIYVERIWRGYRVINRSDDKEMSVEFSGSCVTMIKKREFPRRL